MVKNRSANITSPFILIIENAIIAAKIITLRNTISNIFLHQSFLKTSIALLMDDIIDKSSLAMIGSAKQNMKVKYMPGIKKNKIPKNMTKTFKALNKSIFKKYLKLLLSISR